MYYFTFLFYLITLPFLFIEFDQFLAERASKSKHRPQMQNQEDTTDTMFELWCAFTRFLMD